MWIDRLIGERIRARRTIFGVSLESVGERTTIDVVTLRAYEDGRRRMLRRDLLKIAQALDLTPERLLNGADPRPGRGYPRVTVHRDTVRITHPL